MGRLTRREGWGSMIFIVMDAEMARGTHGLSKNAQLQATISCGKSCSFNDVTEIINSKLCRTLFRTLWYGELQNAILYRQLYFCYILF
jgi:hypothetical protein